MALRCRKRSAILATNYFMCLIPKKYSGLNTCNNFLSVNYFKNLKSEIQRVQEMNEMLCEATGETTFSLSTNKMKNLIKTSKDTY